MEEAIRLGVTQVGENRVQEMEEKRRSLSAPVVWNLQGHLQKNKVKKAVACADLIQSCDSEEILKEIDKKAESAGKVQDVFLEFNISGEEVWVLPGRIQKRRGGGQSVHACARERPDVYGAE